MRRAHMDAGSQVVRNLMTTPGFESASGNVVVRTNQIPNPKFETASGTVNVWTNLVTNPSFEGSNGTTNVWKNLATNATMEAVVASTVVHRTNLCKNPSFEVSLTEWTGQLLKAGYGRSTTRAVTGTSSAWGVANDNQGDSMWVTTTNIVVQPGASYTVSAYAWIPAGVLATDFRSGNRNLWAVSWQGTTATNIGASFLDFTKTNQWQRVSTNLTIPAGSTGLQVRLYCPANDLGIYWDNVLVEQTDQLRPYFDGSTTDERGWDFAWTGTANASTSTAACASTEIARNLVPNPSMVSSDGTFVMRKNLVTDPRATTAFAGYGTQTITPVTISGHPMGITTANRVAYLSNANNPGITFYTPSSNTQYTISAWVYHETAPTAGSQAFAQSGVISQPTPPAIVAGQWQRLSWTHSVGATASPLGFRIGSPVGDGSFLITGIMVETAPILDDYFDGTAPAAQRTNLVPSPSAGAAGGWFHAFLAGTVTFSTNNSGGPLGTPFARALVTSTGTGSNYFAVAHGSTTPSLWTPVTAGLTYTASAYVRVTMTNFSQQPKFRLRWKRADGTTISDEPIVSATGATSGQWVRLSSTGTAPAGAVYAEIMGGYISIDYTTLTVGDSVDVSAALVEQSSVLGSYFDGSTAAVPGTSYGWRGTANASVSYAYSSDLSYIWDGTANASASSQRGNSVTGYMRSGSDTGNPQIMAEGDSKVLRYIYRTETNPIAINIPSLSASNPSMAGKTYTVTAKIRPNFAVNGARLRLGGLDGTGFNLTANQWQTVSLTGVFPDTGYTSALWAPAAGAGNYGKYIDIADVSVVEGVYKGNFFSGSTPSLGDYSYSWTGAINNSASFKKAPRPLNVVASKSSAATGAYFHAISAIENGERYARFISPAGTDNASWRIPMSSGLDYASIVAGSQYTIYVKYRMSGWTSATTVTFGLKDPQSTNAVMSDSNISVTPGSGWQTFSKSFNANINGLSTTNLYIVIPVTPPADQDGIFDIAEWYLVEGNYAGPVFDGSTPAAGDYTYAWQGAADNSASYTVGTLVQGASTGNTKVHQSTYWSRKGKSLRMIPLDVGGSNATSVALPVTLTPGKTYTVLGTRYLDKPLTGTLNSAYGGKIALIQPGISTTDSGTALPNVAGEGFVRWTFTVDPAATGHTLRLGHGGGPNSGEVWWDDVLVVEGTYTGPYFDGSRPAYENLVKTASNAMANSTHTLSVAYAGSTWTRSSVTANGTSLTRQFVDQTSLIPGETYTTAVTLANDQAFSQSISFDWCDVGSVTHVLAPGEVKRIVTSGSRPATGSYVYGSTYRFADLHVLPSTTEARSILFKDWVIERGVTSGDYYTGTGDFGYGWSSTANASTSVQTAPGLSGWGLATNAQIYQSSAFGAKSGTKCGGVATRGANGDGIYYGDITIAPNTVYTFSAWIKTPTVPSFNGVLRWKDAANATIYDTAVTVLTSITANQWSRVSVSALSPANASKVQPMWRIYLPHTPVTFYVDGVNLNEGTDSSFFDGSTAASGDFTYSWMGAADNSYSTENAVKAVGMTGNYSGRVAHQSSIWSASGTKSLAIVSGSRPNVDTFAQWETSPLSGVPILAGKTYTFMGRLRTLESFPVGADGRAWAIHITYNKSGGGTGSINCKPTTTTAGFHEIRQTVTFPSDATTVAFMRLYNGSPNVSPVYWDNIMVVEGTYAGDFINATQNPLAKWTGTVNQSVSIGYPPQLLDLAGKPEADIVTVGHTVLDPTGWSPQEGRTLYTVFTNLQTIPSGGPVSVIANYGDDLFTDTDPNSFLTLRQQRYADTGNSVLNRRTGGGGVQQYPLGLGNHVVSWGTSSTGIMFIAADNKARINDNVVMALPNEKIVISSDNTYNKHIRTLLYRGDHDDATRQAISRYLGNKYGASVA